MQNDLVAEVSKPVKKQEANAKISFAPPYIDQDVIDEVVDTLQSGWITSGPKVIALEEQFKTVSRCKACVCVNSWTSGAQLVLKWWGIGPGDEVIVPAYTYAATALVVLHAGATPVMVDVMDDFTLDPEKIKEAITPRTKAIIPVDIAGWPCDYEAIYKVLDLEGIKQQFRPVNDIQQGLGRILVISDAAHSLGAMINNLPAAACCDVTVYSLHAVKNITTAEGGVICLNLPPSFDNQQVYKWMKINSLNGQTKDAFSKSQAGGWRYDIVSDGLKINMPDICAAIGLSQIRQYESYLLPERKRIFKLYNQAFQKYSWAQLPVYEDTGRASSCHLYALRIYGITEEERDGIIDVIAENNISVNVHFIPLPMLSLFKNMGFNIADYPNAFNQYCREISLPIYPQLTHQQIQLIVENVVDAYQHIVLLKSVL